MSRAHASARGQARESLVGAESDMELTDIAHGGHAVDPGRDSRPGHGVDELGERVKVVTLHA